MSTCGPFSSLWALIHGHYEFINQIQLCLQNIWFWYRLVVFISKCFCLLLKGLWYKLIRYLFMLTFSQSLSVESSLFSIDLYWLLVKVYGTILIIGYWFGFESLSLIWLYWFVLTFNQDLQNGYNNWLLIWIRVNVSDLTWVLIVWTRSWF